MVEDLESEPWVTPEHLDCSEAADGTYVRETDFNKSIAIVWTLRAAGKTLLAGWSARAWQPPVKLTPRRLNFA